MASIPAAAPRLSLLGDRFRVEADYATGTWEGSGQPRALTLNSGSFWFFAPDNVELLVKVLDGCALSNRFWFFAAGMTNVGVELRVTDTWTGQQRTYSNEAGSAFSPILDTLAFPTCDAPRLCGQGTLEEIAAPPRGDRNAEWLALSLGGGLTADEALYQRIAAELAQIRGINPFTQLMSFNPRVAPGHLYVKLTSEAFQRAQNGDYHDWGCLNGWYRVEHIQLFWLCETASLRFKGALNPEQLIPDYEELPGVVEVYGGPIWGPGPGGELPQMLCAWQAGDAIHYFFDQGHWGDGLWEYVSDGPGERPRAVPPDLELYALCRTTHTAFPG